MLCLTEQEEIRRQQGLLNRDKWSWQWLKAWMRIMHRSRGTKDVSSSTWGKVYSAEDLHWPAWSRASWDKVKDTNSDELKRRASRGNAWSCVSCTRFWGAYSMIFVPQAYKEKSRKCRNWEKMVSFQHTSPSDRRYSNPAFDTIVQDTQITIGFSATPISYPFYDGNATSGRWSTCLASQPI